MITNLRRTKKGALKETFFLLFLLFLVILIIGFLIFTNWKIAQKRAELQKKIETLKKEIKILEEKNASLRAGISQTESEEYQTERLYKEGYFEQGANPVVVLPPKEKEKEKEKTSEEKSPFSPQNWWQWLKNKLRD